MILSCLTEKQRAPIFHYKKKYIHNFYAFTIKIDFRNMSESREIRWKNRAKPSQSVHFAIFCSKNHCIYRKTKNTSKFSIVKINVSTNCMCLMINSALWTLSESSEFTFENSLKNAHKSYIFYPNYKCRIIFINKLNVNQLLFI